MSCSTKNGSRAIRRAAFVGFIAGSVALIGCSDDSPDTGSDGTTTEAAGTEISGSVKEWSVEVDEATAPAGDVTFSVTNDGTTLHEFLVVRTDAPDGSIPLDGDAFSENNDSLEVVDEISEFPADTTETLTVNLEPGNYQLVCNLPGHYANGMHTSFTVTG